MTEGALDDIAAMFRAKWTEHVANWQGQVVLHEAVRANLTDTALAWIGLTE